MNETHEKDFGLLNNKDLAASDRLDANAGMTRGDLAKFLLMIAAVAKAVGLKPEQIGKEHDDLEALIKYADAIMDGLNNLM